MNENQIGYLAMAFSLSMLFSNAIFGRMSDIFGRMPFLYAGLIFSSFSTVFLLYGHSFGFYLLGRVLNGFCLGIFPSSIYGLASDRDVKFGKLSAFGSIGWASGGLIGGYLADYYNLEFIFLLSGIFYFVGFFISFTVEKGKLSQDVTDSSNVVHDRSTKSVLKQNWLIYTIVILRHGTANSIWIFWVLFLSQDLSLSTTEIGVVQATNMFTQFIVMRTMGDRFPPEKMFFSGIIISSIAFYSFVLTSNFLEIVLTQVILGISWGFFLVGGLRTVETKSRKTNSVATATGLFNGSIAIAQILGPPLAIVFYNYSNSYTFSMIVAAIITAMSAIFYAFSETEFKLKHEEPTIS